MLFKFLIAYPFEFKHDFATEASVATEHEKETSSATSTPTTLFAEGMR